MKKLLTLLLLSLVISSYALAQSGFDRMTTPLSNPHTFQDPRTQTDGRFIFMYNDIDSGLGGGNLQYYGIKTNLQIADNFALMLNQIGYYRISPSDASSQNGWGDVEIGGKYSFHNDASAGTIGTFGVLWKPASGSSDVGQGQGDGHIHPFVSFGAQVDAITVIGSSGLRVPFSGRDSSFWDVGLHASSQVGPLTPLVEFNLIQTVDKGKRVPLRGEGLDLINFGATDARGRTFVSSTIGARYELADGINWGAGFQFPLTSGPGSDFMKWRITSDLVFNMG